MQKKYMRLHITLFVVALTTSIVGYAGEYQEPVGDATAKIEFIDDASQKMSIHFYADSKECTDRTNSGVKPNEQRKLAIVAGQDVTFTVGMDPKGASAALSFGAIGALVGANIFKGCTPTITFHPEAGRNYVFRMNTDGKDCSYKFYAKPAAEGAQPGEELPVAFGEREWFRAWGNSGPWCKKNLAGDSK
jgi:hypothetical protein